MDVSIVIVNYNTSDLILKCLNSVFAKTKNIEFEVIVVDNSSSDDSVNIIRRNFNRVIVVESAESIGFGRANNLGAKYAIGKYLFFLNPDTFLINNAIKILYDYMLDNPSTGICGGNLYDLNMQYVHSYSLFYPSVFEEFNSLTGGLLAKIKFGRYTRKNETNNPISVAYITGADMLIAKQQFKNVEGFSSDFFMYYEETELSFRLNKIGLKSINVPTAQIIHLEGKSFDVNEKKLSMFFQGRKIFY